MKSGRAMRGIGGFVLAVVLLHAPSRLWAATVTLEAEAMPTKTTGGAVTDGWALWSNGYVEGPATFPVTAEYTFQVVARGDWGGGSFPIMDLRIDQGSIGNFRLTSVAWQTYTLRQFISAGTHRVAVAFTNDYYNPPEDRNLYVDKVQISPVDATPPVISSITSSGVTATSATITWGTDEAATSQVEYGTTTSYGQMSSLDATLVTSHSAGLSGLMDGMLYHYRVRSKDAAGNEGISADGSFTTPDISPPTGTVTINGGAAATNKTAATLTLVAADNAGSVSHMRFSNSGTSYSTAEAYATTKAWTLTTGNGTKTVYGQFKDAAGNWSAAVTDTIVLDTYVPSVSGVTVSAITATSASVSWTTNEPATSQVDYGLTTSYGQTTPLDASLVTSHSVPLSGLTAGTKYYYRIRSKDAAGNEKATAANTFTTSAAPDTTPPTVALTAPAGGATVTGTITVSATATDTVGVAGVQFQLDGANLGAEDAASPYSVSWNTTTATNASHALTAVARDAAGNRATSAAATVTVNNVAPDTTPPSGSIIINGGAAATNNPTVTLTLSATDNSGTVAQTQFSNNGTTYSAAEAYGTSKSWTLAAGDGAKTVYAKFKDAAGNWSAPVSDTITLDTTPPAVSFTSPVDGAVLTAP